MSIYARKHVAYIMCINMCMEQCVIYIYSPAINVQMYVFFCTALTKFVKYKEFRQLATLNYTSDMYNMYSIVSSIEFDKDSDYFAIAGVTKKIKVVYLS